MVQERQLPVTEIKAGLKLAKKFYEIELDDTDYIKGIKSLLTKGHFIGFRNKRF